jgi:hypothetical protein
MTCCGSKFNWPGIWLFAARVKGHRRHRPRTGRLAPEVIIPAHCTSWKAAHTTVRHLPGAFITNSVGTIFHLTGPSAAHGPRPDTARAANVARGHVQHHLVAALTRHGSSMV